jgi:hypothetical protein
MFLAMTRPPPAGDEYYVKLVDGTAKTVDASHLALNLSKGSPVLYTPPAGGESVKGTIVASDGSYWSVSLS